jgi:hypothetical protein
VRDGIRISPQTTTGTFGHGSGAESRLRYNDSDCLDYNIWLSQMHIVIRIGGHHHLSTLKRQLDEISLHIFPGMLVLRAQPQTRGAAGATVRRAPLSHPERRPATRLRAHEARSLWGAVTSPLRQDARGAASE